MLTRVLALSLLAGCTLADAQAQNSRPTQTAAVTMGQDPFRLESIGLTMFLPVDSAAQASRVGSVSTVQVIPKDATWMLNIQTPKSANTETTAAEVLDNILVQVIASGDEVYDTTPGQRAKLTGMRGRVTEPRSAIVINGREAQRAYVEIPQDSGPAVVRGYTVFRTVPGQFATFELVTTQTELAKAKPTYETTLATVTFENPAMVFADRAAAVTAGQRLLAGLSQEEFRRLVENGGTRWERLYRPASSGSEMDATEIAYRRIAMTMGNRGMVMGGTSSRSIDRQEGFIIRIDARALDGKRTFDSRSVFFVTPDGEEEAWQVRNAVREGTKVSVFTETGARTGTSMSVQLEGTGVPGEIIKPIIQGDGYVSRVLSWMLPQIIVDAKAQADYGFYTYQSDASAIKLRRDTLTAPADRPNTLLLTTKLTEDRPPQVTVFNSEGKLIRTELPDGTIWEPVTLEKLGQLWKAKGLPLD